jgi:hypothetical protein
VGGPGRPPRGRRQRLLDARFRRLSYDWWPDEETLAPGDVDRLLANAAALGGVDLLLTHTPPAWVTRVMTRGGAPHPSAVLVEDAWRALGGVAATHRWSSIIGHMHEAWRSERLRVDAAALRRGPDGRWELAERLASRMAR